MKQQFLIDAADDFQTYVYENNRKIIPTSATITVTKPGSSTELIASTAVAVGGDGLLSYSLTAGNNATADANYKVVISYVYNSATFTVTLFYDVVNSKLFKVITDDDIVNELPQLKENGWKTHGTALSGSTTTIVDSELERFADDYFTGGTAYSIDQDATKNITDFVSSTGTVTTEAFDSAVATDKYILSRSFTKEIQRSFEKIEDMLKRQGKRPHLILDSSDLREVHITFAVAEVCKGLISSGESENLWEGMWMHYEKKGDEIFRSLDLKYDESEDGIIQGSEENVRTNKTLGRA